jgi:hypothetical protein
MSDQTEDSGNTEELVPQEDPGRHKRGDARRALLGGVVGLALLAGPIVLANTIIDDSGDGDVSTDEAATSLIAQRTLEDPVQTDAAQLQSLLTRRTTTTLPPTTTTTAPPPPPPTTAPPTTEPPTTAPPATDPPAPSSGSGQLGDPYYDGSWDKLAQCESGGNWAINTGNGYYGGIQFSLQSWRGVGGTGYPHEASREVQIEMGKRLWESQGWAGWPGCTSKFGWR